MNETLRFMGPSSSSLLPESSLQLSAALSALANKDESSKLNYPNTNLQASNASFIIQKNTGLFQFLFQVGSYSMSTLASKLEGSEDFEKNSFGIIPHAYISYHPDPHWSIQAGKLLSMPGYENPFSYQNQNVQRGLLEHHNNTISRGLQINYTQERSAFFATLNDGFYSGELKWLGWGGSYEFSDQQKSQLMLAGAFKPSSVNTNVTPLLQNNSQIINWIHSIKWGNWSLTPYYQWTLTPANATTSLPNAAKTQGYALILDHQRALHGSAWWPNASTLHFPIRIEHLKYSNFTKPGLINLGFGPNSQAYSLTFTPTLQSGVYFLRNEWSWFKFKDSNFIPLSVTQDQARSQTRVLLEWGMLY